MKRVILALISLYIIPAIVTNTYEPEFEKLYSVEHIKDGDKSTYAEEGDKVSVHYTGTFPKTGKKFDSSVDRNTPFTFSLKKGQVIQCWDEVVSKMTQGEKIKVICPSRLAYGSRGAGGVIPGDTDIAFEIEFLSFTKGKNDL